MVDETNDPKKIIPCKWKPAVRKKINGEIKVLSFPCRFPESEKTSDICTPCLLGDIFAMQFTQMDAIKKQSGLNEEIMTFLRQYTSDGSLDDFR